MDLYRNNHLCPPMTYWKPKTFANGEISRAQENKLLKDPDFNSDIFANRPGNFGQALFKVVLAFLHNADKETEVLTHSSRIIEAQVSPTFKPTSQQPTTHFNKILSLLGHRQASYKVVYVNFPHFFIFIHFLTGHDNLSLASVTLLHPLWLKLPLQ